MKPIDYDTIAHAYDRRYQLHDYPGIRRAIMNAVGGTVRARVLEVGCGTGRWIAELSRAGHEVSGVDPSDEMLKRAVAKVSGDLRVGRAEALPWDDDRFDLVLFVNSVHHLEGPRVALREAYRVLRSGGQVLSIGLDPHEGTGRWFVHEFFPSTLVLDLARFPSSAQRTKWLAVAGFEDITVRIAERLESTVPLDAALQRGILERSFTSQLSALALEDYTAGMDAIRRAASSDRSFRLHADLALFATTARRSG